MHEQTDHELMEACRKEQRCLVTLDLDFANPLLFAPSGYAGIVVLRLLPKPSVEGLLSEISALVRAVRQSDISGKLWILQRGKIREYQPENS